ncbi:MAG: MEDS domain-containing protein [Vicinamibacteria bacterium]
MKVKAPWDDVLAEPLCREHLVQVYQDLEALRSAFALFAGVGIGKGDSVVAIATQEHADAFRDTLADDGFDPYSLQQWGQLRFVDAASLMHGFMRNGVPEAGLFGSLAGILIRDAEARSRTGRVRLYGEMVNLLWREWNLPGAAALERLWNQVIPLHRAALFCAYEVQPEAPPLPHSLARLHSHVIPVAACC